MTTGKLVTNLYLTLLGNIDLSHLQNTRRKFIADWNSELLALHFSIKQLILADIVHDEFLNECIRVVIICPVITLDSIEFKVLQCRNSELATLGNNLSTSVIFHTLRNLTFSKRHQFVYKNILQVIVLCLILFIYLCKEYLILLLGIAGLNSTREQFLVNNDTAQWRIGLQWRIFHIASLITEDCTKQLLFRRRIALSLWRNLANEDVTWFYTCTNTDYTIIIEIFGCFLTDVWNIWCEFLNTTLGLTNIKRIFVYVNRGKHIFAHHTLWNNDSILVVVTLPRDIGNKQVTTKCQFTILSSIAFCQDISCLDTLPLITDRTKVDSHILIGTTELWNAILLQCRFEADKLVFFCAVIKNAYCRCINIFDNTVTFSCNHCTWILTYLLLKSGTYNRCIIVNQWHSLTHHITSHQCTVTVIMLQEWNQGSWNRCNLLWWNVYQINLIGSYYRVVCILTTLYRISLEGTIYRKRCVSLTDNLVFFLFCCQINDILVIHVYFCIVNLTIRGNDETKIIDLCIDTEGRYQTDIWPFRTLNWTETTIVSIVYVANLETCTLTWQTTRAKSRQTTLVSNLGKWVCLVHELAQRIGSKERVDNAWDSLRINKVSRSEHFIVTNVHTLTNSAAHACQTNGKLIGKLFSYRAHTAVTQVVDIINSGIGINQLDEIFYDFNNIVFSQHTGIHVCVEPQLLIDTVTSYLTEVITLIREEQVLEDFTCTGIICRISIAQLAIDVVDGFFLWVAGILW